MCGSAALSECMHECVTQLNQAQHTVAHKCVAEGFSRGSCVRHTGKCCLCLHTSCCNTYVALCLTPSAAIPIWLPRLLLLVRATAGANQHHSGLFWDFQMYNLQLAGEAHSCSRHQLGVHTYLQVVCMHSKQGLAGCWGAMAYTFCQSLSGSVLPTLSLLWSLFVVQPW